MPIRPPSDVRFKCAACNWESDSTVTSVWTHQREEHPEAVQPWTWELLGTVAP